MYSLCKVEEETVNHIFVTGVGMARGSSYIKLSKHMESRFSRVVYVALDEGCDGWII